MFSDNDKEILVKKRLTTRQLLFRLTVGLVIVITGYLVMHGVERFWAIEGASTYYGFFKSTLFLVLIEMGGSIGLFVAFSRAISGWDIRAAGGLLALFCLITSVFIQFPYFRGKVDFDWWFGVVLPLMELMLAALAGRLEDAPTVEKKLEAQTITNQSLTINNTENNNNTLNIEFIVKEVSESLKNHVAAVQEELKTDFQELVAREIANMKQLPTSNTLANVQGFLTTDTDGNNNTDFEGKENVVVGESVGGLMSGSVAVTEREKALARAKQFGHDMGLIKNNAPPSDALVDLLDFSIRPSANEVANSGSNKPKAFTLFEQNKSNQEIVTILGCSLRSVQGWRKAWNESKENSKG